MNWLVLGLIGGAVGLDATAFPQAMWSRPIVAGTAAGLVFGRPFSGLVVGVVLEVFALLILPFGAARYPESGTAAAAAAAAYCAVVPGTDYRMLLIAVVFALAWEHVAGASVIFVRRLNERMVAAPRAEGLSDRQVTRRHLAALAIEFLRGAWAVLIGALLGILLLQVLSGTQAPGQAFSEIALRVAVAAMLGAALSLFGGWRQRWLSFSLGLLCGSLLLGLQ